MKNPNSFTTLFRKSHMIIERSRSLQIIELIFSLEVELENTHQLSTGCPKTKHLLDLDSQGRTPTKEYITYICNVRFYELYPHPQPGKFGNFFSVKL